MLVCHVEENVPPLTRNVAPAAPVSVPAEALMVPAIAVSLTPFATPGIAPPAELTSAKVPLTVPVFRLSAAWPPTLTPALIVSVPKFVPTIPATFELLLITTFVNEVVMVGLLMMFNPAPVVGPMLTVSMVAPVVRLAPEIPASGALMVVVMLTPLIVLPFASVTALLAGLPRSGGEPAAATGMP